MKKISKLITLLVLGGLLFACSNTNTSSSSNNEPLKKEEYTVRFLDNLEGTTITASGMEATTFNSLVYTATVTAGEKVSQPTVTLNPVPGYKFDDWYTEKECKNVYDFNAIVNSNLTLFAGYVRDAEAVVIDDYSEPELNFEEKIDDTLALPLVVSGVLNASLTSEFSYDENHQHTNGVSLSASGMKKLSDNADDCLKYLNYSRKQAVSDLEASYSEGAINLTFNYSNTAYAVTINVTLANYTLTNNSGFETKATRYDAYDFTDFSIIMGGSSSMENWSTSVEDMKPVTTFNVGIGGTKVEDWMNYMNPRIVYPNNPRGVVYYLGINNIINGSDNGTVVGNALTAMFDDVHEHLPNTTIYFILINHVPGYLKYVEQIDIANDIVNTYSEDKDYMVLIDAGSLLLKANGEPSWSYFKTDGLHMSQYGYVIWGQEVKRVVMDHEREIYG